MKLIIYTDGSAKPNPGRGGFGYVVMRDGSQVYGRGVYIEGRQDVTNNEAEYLAVIAALEYANEMERDDATVDLFLDSELVAKQVTGAYATNKATLVPLRDRVRALVRETGASIAHVLRARNELANDLANAAVDRRCDVELTTAIVTIAPSQKRQRRE